MGDTETMNPYAIAGIVVRTLPVELEDVADRLARLPGIEVHHVEISSGRVVVTLETEHADLGGAELERLRDVSGVVSVELVYQYVAPPVEGPELTPSMSQGAV